MSVVRPSPPSSALTRPYWDATAAGRLDLQACAACGERPFPPRLTCPACGSRDLAWSTVSGRGRVHTFTVVHRAPHPSFADEVPFVVAVVELDEGPRLTTNIVDCSPSDVTIGIPVEVTFLPLGDGDVTLPVFRPSIPVDVDRGESSDAHR